MYYIAYDQPKNDGKVRDFGAETLPRQDYGEEDCASKREEGKLCMHDS
jgi:hypothetical protein